MSLPRKRVVDCVSSGVPRKKLKSCIETIAFIIHDFENRSRRIINSPTLMAHGRRWKITCQPKPDPPNPFGPFGGPEYVGFFLSPLRKDGVTVNFAIRCKNLESKATKKFGSDSDIWGWSTFAERPTIMKYLEEDGSLEIEVDIQIESLPENSGVWYPKNIQRQDILVDLYHDARSETADAVFSVGDNEYHVHKSILNLRCKKLYEIAKEYDNDNGVPIPIDSTRGEIFKSVLDFVYTVIPEINDSNIAEELLIAADCYECIPLKLYVESVIVDKLITPENAAELFLFADSHSCPLLREKAISVFVSDASKVKKAKEWSTIKESNMFINEFLEAVTSEESCTDKVTILREQLEEANLELDGSLGVLAERFLAFRRKKSEAMPVLEEDSKWE